MVTIPPAVLVERCQQQLASLDCFEHFLTGAYPGHSFAQRSRETIEQSCTQHEKNQIAGKAVEHLSEISADWTLCARKGAYVPSKILRGLGGSGSNNSQSGRPALCLGMQQLHFWQSQHARPLVLKKVGRLMQIKS